MRRGQTSHITRERGREIQLSIDTSAAVLSYVGREFIVRPVLVRAAPHSACDNYGWRSTAAR